jgi:Tol biopolymer transport system component
MIKIPNVFRIILILLPIIMVTETCKKTSNQIPWPEGFTGKFAISTVKMTTIAWAVYLFHENGFTQLSTGGNLVFPSCQWSRDGSRLLIDLSDGLTFFRIADSDGNVLKEIEGCSPIFSQDGTRIAYLGWDYGGTHDRMIYTVNASGTDSLVFGRIPPSGFTLEEWSPDRSKITFSTRIWHIDSVGFADANGYTVFMKGSGPVWSGDGSGIYFFNDSSLWKYVLSDSSVGKVVDLGAVQEFYSFGWSPDKSRKAYTLFEANKGNIYVVKMDGSAPVRLTDAPDNCWYLYPCWSTDGSRIACHDGKSLWIMNSDGSHPVSMTIVPEVNGLPIVGTLQEFDWY